MTPQLGACLGCVLVAFVVAAGWLLRQQRTPRGAALVCAVLALTGGLAAVLADLATTTEAWQRWTAVVVLGAAAVVVGAAATVAVLSLADKEAGRTVSTVRFQGLRGGAWIGVLERVGIFAALATGYPDGVALILAVKGLARYPELRAGQQSGVAERFIIGTFTSMAVAAGCAGVLRLLG